MKNGNIVCLLLLSIGFSFVLSLPPQALAADKAADKKSDTVTVGYFTQKPAADFDKTTKNLFLNFESGCKHCEILNETPYAADGSVDMKALVEKVKSLTAQQVSFLFFDFNVKATEGNKALIDALNEKENQHILVVSSAGAPADGDISSPLNRTVMGQVHDALIIGELGEKDRLAPPNSFFGPETLTALRPPKELIGQGVAPLLFASDLAQRWNKRTPQGWLDFFRMKKMKNRKIWLEFGDIFY